MNNLDILNGQFDVNIHKEWFIDYLEVVVLEDGTVEYAVPSHELKLVNVLSCVAGLSFDEITERYNQTSWSDIIGYLSPIEWLCNQTKCISVWTGGYIGNANENQLRTLQNLKDHGVYHGEIYK